MPARHCTAPRSPRHRHDLIRSIALVCLLVCTLSVEVVRAQTPTMTLDQAIRAAQKQVRGKLVAADTERHGEQIVYRIRILGADGVVRTVVIDASARP